MAFTNLKKMVVILPLALLGSLAQASADPKMLNGKSVYGEVATAAEARRVVDVRSADNFAIDCGTVVTFTNGKSSFTWRFDAVHHGAVDLEKIAPKDFLIKPLRVYVWPTEYERGG